MSFSDHVYKQKKRNSRTR